MIECLLDGRDQISRFDCSMGNNHTKVETNRNTMQHCTSKLNMHQERNKTITTEFTINNQIYNNSMRY